MLANKQIAITYMNNWRSLFTPYSYFMNFTIQSLMAFRGHSVESNFNIPSTIPLYSQNSSFRQQG